ncbi:MAG: hypothetical protein WCJ17_02685 [bacterium]
MNVFKIMVAATCVVSCVYSSEDLRERCFRRSDGEVIRVLSDSYAADTPALRASLSADIVRCVREFCAEYDLPYAFSDDETLLADEYSNFTIEETSKISVSHKIQLLGDVLAYMQHEMPLVDKSRELYHAIQQELTHMVDSWEKDTSLGTQVAIEDGYNSLITMNFLPFASYTNDEGFRGFAARVVTSLEKQGPYALMPVAEDVELFVNECSLHTEKMMVEAAIRLFCKNVSRFAVLRAYLVILNSALLTLERALPPVVSIAYSLQQQYLVSFVLETKQFIKNVLSRRGALAKIKEFDILFAAIFKHAHRTTEGLCMLENLAVCEVGTSSNKDKARDALIQKLGSVKYDATTHSYPIAPTDGVISAARAYFASCFNDNRDTFIKTELPKHISATCPLEALKAEFSVGWPEFGRKSRVKASKGSVSCTASVEDDAWMDAEPTAGGGCAGAGGPGKAPRKKGKGKK